ncbi:MAG: Fe-S cluster assembly protein SufD [Cyclobacteriaceae bacterium]
MQSTKENKAIEVIKTLVPSSAPHQHAFEQFSRLGFPTRKDEEFKFTPIDRFFAKNFIFDGSINDASDLTNVEAYLFEEEGNHFVFINGKYRKDLSSIIDVSEKEMIEFSEGSDWSDLLSHSLAINELSIEIKANESPLPCFVYNIVDAQSSAQILNPRLSISLGQGAKLEICEKTIVIGSHPVFVNKINKINVGANANYSTTKIEQFPSNVLWIETTNGSQARDSRFYSNVFTFSGKLVRNTLNVAQDDENCETHMHGLYLLTGDSHVDNHTSVDHRNPNSYSNELYKGIVDEKSTAVFNGKIYVRPGAQQTNAFQSNKNISLSEQATIHTKPQLEIWADDVKCSHGCTVGQMDEEAIFYLRSRGIDQRSAKALLLQAFAEETFENVPFDFIKEELHQVIAERLL